MKLQCEDCSHIYHKELSEKAYFAILNGDAKDPPCPKKACRDAAIQRDIETRARNMAGIIATQKAPGRVGSTLARAVDLTANITMQDHGLTDLRDDNRVGESSTPKLPAHQQEQVENFFGAARKVAQSNPQLANRLAAMPNIVNSGALAHQPDTKAVDAMLSNPQKPKIRVLGEYNERPS